jgi:hypothetical protein
MNQPVSPRRPSGIYGKHAPQFPTGLKELSSYVKGGALPAPPASVNNYAGLSWPMDGNNSYGDCTMAAAAHAIQCWNQVAATKDAVPSQNAVISQYLRLTHGQDSGLAEANVLKTWQSSGLWQNRIMGYAPVNVHDQTTLQQSISLFGLSYVGIQLPANAETQFSERQPWSLVPGWQHQQIIGGHAVIFAGYDANYLYAVTWGAIQPVSWEWWHTYGDEAWAILPNEYKEAGTVDRIDYATLLADLALV